MEEFESQFDGDPEVAEAVAALGEEVVANAALDMLVDYSTDCDDTLTAYQINERLHDNAVGQFLWSLRTEIAEGSVTLEQVAEATGTSVEFLAAGLDAAAAEDADAESEGDHICGHCLQVASDAALERGVSAEEVMDALNSLAGGGAT